MFEVAARKKYRFKATNGMVSVEDLWDLTLTHLNSIAVALNKQIREASEDSFLETAKKADVDTVNKLEIVKHVIKVKQDEKKASEAAKDKAQRKQELMEIIKQKQNQELTNKSIDELVKELESL